MRNLKLFSMMLAFAMVASAGMVEAGTVLYEEHFNIGAGDGEFTAGPIAGQNGFVTVGGDGLDITSSAYLGGDGSDGQSQNNALFSVPASCTDLRIQMRVRMRQGSSYDQTFRPISTGGAMFWVGCGPSGWRLRKVDGTEILSASDFGGENLSSSNHRYFQIRLDYDFVDQEGTFSAYREIADGGDYHWTTITNFTGAEIGLTSAMDDPEEWTGLLFRMDNVSSRFDDIYVIDRTDDNALPYTTGLNLWLDGSDVDGVSNGSMTDGQDVTVWNNKVTDSAAGNAFTAQLTTKGGTFRTEVAAEKLLDAVEFDGVDDAFRMAEFMETNLTIYAVAKCTGGSGNRTLFMDWSSNGGMAYLYVNTLTSEIQLRDNDSDEFSHAAGGQMFDNEWARGMVVLSTSGDDCTIEVGEVGATSSTTETGDYTPHSRMPVGYDNTGPTLGKWLLEYTSDEQRHFGGQLAEFLVYDHALSAADRTAVEQYLFSKYWVSGTMFIVR